jgi:protease-4
VVAALRLAEKNRRVAAILFHVESPGGDALASDLIWREVERVRAKKPVVVLMGNAAASGGYYVSTAGNHVVARRNTITGSIGVLSIRPVASGLYEKLGVHPAAVQRGARAGLLDLSQHPTPDELRVLKDQIGFIYDEFKDRVTRGRGLGADELEDKAGGRVWTGAEALDLGLADEVGGFGEAVRKARELGKVEREGPESLIKISAPRSGRPAPGKPAEAVREMVDDARQALLELRAARIWAVAPYEISED